jgi:GntR family transcriptional regulator
VTAKSEQARRSLLARIKRSKPHSALPSERLLAEQLGVSRTTLRKVLDDLHRDGLVYTRDRTGTFVSEPRMSKGTNLMSFSQEMRDRGITPGAVVLLAHLIPAPGEVSEILDLPRDSRMYHLRRLRTGDGEPFCLEETYIPASVTPGLLEQDLEGSLYQLLRENYERPVALVHHAVTAVTVDEEAARHLKVAPGSAALLFANVSWDQAGRPVEYTTSLKRGDRNEIRYDVRPRE